MSFQVVIFDETEMRDWWILLFFIFSQSSKALLLKIEKLQKLFLTIRAKASSILWLL